MGVNQRKQRKKEGESENEGHLDRRATRIEERRRETCDEDGEDWREKDREDKLTEVERERRINGGGKRRSGGWSERDEEEKETQRRRLDRDRERERERERDWYMYMADT